MDVDPASIRRARLDAGMTMSELAGSELTKGAIYLFESGRARPSVETLELIGRRTGKPVSYFQARGGGIGDDVRSAHAQAEVELAMLRGNLNGAIELAHRYLARDADSQVAGAIRLTRARAHLRLGHAEAALDDVRELLATPAAADAGGCMAVEARLLEVEVLRHLDPSAAMAAGGRLLEAMEGLEPRWPLLRARALVLLGAIQADAREWEQAAATLAEVIGAGLLAPALRAEAAASEHEAGRRLDAGQRLSALLATARAVALETMREHLEMTCQAAIDAALALRRTGAAGAARTSLEHAQTLGTVLGIPSAASRAGLGRAELALLDGDVEEAAAQLRAALDVAERTGDEQAAGIARLLGARLHVHAGEPGPADADFLAAIATFARLGDRGRLYQARSAYAEALEARGDVHAALAQWKEAARISGPELMDLEDPHRPDELLVSRPG